MVNLIARPSLSLSDFSLPVSFENAEIGQCPNLAPPPPPLPPLPPLPEKEEPEEEKEELKPLRPPPTPAPATPPPGPPAVSGSLVLVGVPNTPNFNHEYFSAGVKALIIHYILHLRVFIYNNIKA